MQYYALVFTARERILLWTPLLNYKPAGATANEIKATVRLATQSTKEMTKDAKKGPSGCSGMTLINPQQSRRAAACSGTAI